MITRFFIFKLDFKVIAIMLKLFFFDSIGCSFGKLGRYLVFLGYFYGAKLFEEH
jgi:hypothetical protein